MKNCLLCCLLVLVVLILVYTSSNRRPFKRWRDFVLLVAILCQLWCCKKSWDMRNYY